MSRRASRLLGRNPMRLDHNRLEEVFIVTQVVQHHLWRAVDKDGVVPGILVQARRDAQGQSASSNGCWRIYDMGRRRTRPTIHYTDSNNLDGKGCFSGYPSRSRRAVPFHGSCPTLFLRS